MIVLALREPLGWIRVLVWWTRAKKFSAETFARKRGLWFRSPSEPILKRALHETVRQPDTEESKSAGCKDAAGTRGNVDSRERTCVN